MSGLVSMAQENTDLEKCAADEAYTLWSDGYFVQNGRRWRFFTALKTLKVYCSSNGDEWDLMGDMDPIRDVREVATLLQNQYDSVTGIKTVG